MQRRINAQKTLYEKAKADEQSTNEQLNWIMKREREALRNFEAASADAENANLREAQIEEDSETVNAIAPQIHAILAKEREIQK